MAGCSNVLVELVETKGGSDHPVSPADFGSVMRAILDADGERDSASLELGAAAVFMILCHPETSH